MKVETEKDNTIMSSCFNLPFFRHRDSLSSLSTPIQDDGKSIVRYSYKTLKIATQGFHRSSKVGEGGFGSVYKGKLKNGVTVAIKVLSAKSLQGEREFVAEIESMTRAKHQNLLRLSGYCIEGSNRILVYDYMEKNSLAQTLLGGRHCDIDSTWEIRRKIALGIAHGLAYLHEEIKPQIIHRDIKPSNILLDSNLVPKISDFGLAKLFPDNLTHVSTRVAGTIGYLAPEYARCGKLTRKSDVYSFGALLLEIVSGRTTSSHAFGLDKYNMVEKAWQLYNDNNLLQLIDHSMKNDLVGGEEEEAEHFLKVALLCVQEMPSHRPCMSRVVKMLSTKGSTKDLRISQPGVIKDLKILKVDEVTKSKGTASSSTSVNQSSSSFSN